MKKPTISELKREVLSAERTLAKAKDRLASAIRYRDEATRARKEFDRKFLFDPAAPRKGHVKLTLEQRQMIQRRYFPDELPPDTD